MKLPILTAVGDKIPNPSMSNLSAISQIGLVIYMFLIGLEFNTKLLKHHIKSASLLSAAGIINSFILGAIASFWFDHNDDFF